VTNARRVAHRAELGHARLSVPAEVLGHPHLAER